jgi:predicted DNA-binding transcriptional regulator YafY
MNRLNRLTALLLLLQTRRVVTSDQLAERFSVSRRTIYRDIRVLEEAGVPILSEAGVGYALARGYHLPPVMFTRDQAGALITGGKLMASFADLAVSENYQEALDKIRSVLDRADQRYLERLEDHMAVLSPPGKPPTRGDGRMLARLQALLGDQRVVAMTYHSGGKDEVTRREVEPLVLCFYGAHWHLLAYCRLRGDYRDFRVDRICELAATRTAFEAQRHGRIDQLIERMVVPTDLKFARVHFTRAAAAQVRENRYYWGFVEERPQAEGVEMHFLTPDYDYLARWLVGFCDRVRVLAPAELDDRIRAFARRLYRHYFK